MAQDSAVTSDTIGISPGPAEPVAVLGSVELALYEQARKAVENQRQLRQRAEAALADASFVERAVENEFLRVMTGICEDRGLPTTGGYVVDAAGRVFHNASNTPEPNTTSAE